MTRREAEVVLGERYRLIDPIAAGGMGTVWLAEDQRLGRRVAVKLLNEGLAEDPKFLERFLREAQAAAGLTHHNVAGVFDYGEDGSRPYIVMELVEGETVAQKLTREGTLDPAEAAGIAAGVADALAEAHGAGIVHRDIKPANVILSSKGTTKVTDFGIASSAMSSNLTATGMVMGTARYLSPEQARGEKATPASDIYAVGVLLYEMLTGAPPFTAETPVATAMAHMNDAPEPIRARRPEVPAALAAIAEAALAKDPAARPSSAAVLAAELHAAAVSPAGEDPDATEAIRRDPTAVLTPAEGMPPPRPSGRIGMLRRRWLMPVVLVLIGLTALLLISQLLGGGAPRVKVPTFTGLTRAEAAARAQNAGLQLTFSREESEEPENTVIAQIPKAGGQLEQGSTVALILSSGPPLATVPRLVGLEKEEDVIAALEAAGLEFGGIEFVDGGPGIVGSVPAEGERVPRGSLIKVLVGGDGPGNGNGDGGNGKDKKDGN